MKPEESSFELHGDLSALLRPKWRNSKPLDQPVTRRASIKDVLESFGLPHTEIGRIELEGREVDFSHIVEKQQLFSVYPLEIPWDVTKASFLRPNPLDNVRFIVDVNVAALARYLRMAGLDVLYNPGLNDNELVDLAFEEQRIALTRDLGLLQRKKLEFGRYVRAIKPVDQLQEIVNLFGLKYKLKPFTRCLQCNSILQPVEKKDIIDRLEPLTKKYYSTFSLCLTCDKIYWSGSHIDDMRQLFSK